MKITHRAVITAAAAAAALAGGGSLALAAVTGGGPPVSSQPGPYVKQGQTVNLCLSQTAENVFYWEAHSQVLGNCQAGYEQVTVVAQPSALPSPP